MVYTLYIKINFSADALKERIYIKQLYEFQRYIVSIFVICVINSIY